MLEYTGPIRECPGCAALITTMRTRCLRCQREVDEKRSTGMGKECYVAPSGNFEVIQQTSAVVIRCKCGTTVIVTSTERKISSHCGGCGRRYSIESTVHGP